MIGQTLVNRYRIDAELGKGGMGTVFRGYDTLLNRTVAIKAISREGIGAEGRARLLSEARAVARLNHPNIVTIYDTVYENNQPFIIMELVEGRTLRSIASFSVDQCIDYVRQICQALTHAHSKGIIHRDLKPENAMLTSENIVKLMDFGLARSIDAPHVTRTGAIIGTLAYIAPEIIDGKEPSEKSDLYALGIMMFEMLTGQLPFKGGDLLQIILQHMQAPIPSAREIQSNVPSALDVLTMQMMSKAPEDRPASAKEVDDVLSALESGHRQATRQMEPEPSKVRALPDLAQKRSQAQKEWDKKWSKKGFTRSSLPVIEPAERKLILSNREKEIALGIEHFKNHRLLIINGMPGIGKSTLARALLEFMPVESPPPFWYDFDRHQSSGNTLGILLDRISSYLEFCLGSEVRQDVMAFRNSPNNQASSYDVDVLIDYLNQDPPIWMVFDNLETVLTRGSNHFSDEGIESLFSGLKSNTHSAKIIITNPFVPVLHDGKLLLEFGTLPLTLRGLEEGSSISFLKTFGLDKFPEDVLISIARAVDGHPFTLNNLSHYVQSLGATSSLDDLQAILQDTTEHFKISLQKRLSPQEYNALQSISILHKEISMEGLCKTAQTNPGTIKRLREEGLLQANETGKFWIPKIIKNTLQAENNESLQQAHARATSYYRSQKIPNTRDTIDDFVSVIEWHHHAVQACDAISSYQALFSTGLKTHLMAWNEYTLLGDLCQATASILGSKHHEISNLEWAELQFTLGNVRFINGKYDDSLAHLQSALESIPPEENNELRIQTMIYLAEAHNARKATVAASTLCQEILEVLNRTPNKGLEAKAHQLKGLISKEQGLLEQAIHEFASALGLYEQIHDVTGIAYTTGELGNVHYALGQYAKALLNYRRTCHLCNERRDLRGVMIAHFNIGDILLQDEQYELAEKEFNEAVTLAHKKKFSWVELLAGLSLIETKISLTQLDQAEQALDALKPLLAEHSEGCFAGQELVLRGSLKWKQNQIEQAQNYFDQAIRMLDSEDCRYMQARALLAYGKFALSEGSYKKTESALLDAKAIFAARNNLLGIRAVEKEWARLEQAVRNH